MKIFLPNSAFPQNFAGFVKHFDPADESVLEVSMNPSYVNVHPAALSMTAAAGVHVLSQGGHVEGTFEENNATQYLQRMGLFDLFQFDVDPEYEEHEEAGRFVPLRIIKSSKEQSDFLNDLVPMLHADDQKKVDPVLYVVSELLRNVLEHSGSKIGAVVCAQYYRKSRSVGVGVADAGVGMLKSMQRSHAVTTDLDAIMLAMRPGVTGATAKYGGDDTNAGAGLFFTKSIARASRHYMVAYSGSSMYKLTPGSEYEDPELFADPDEDPHTTEIGLPEWCGTVMGLNISIEGTEAFGDLIGRIRDAYHLSVKLEKKEARKARFK